MSDNRNEPMIELPRYKCHKEVHALKILEVEPREKDGVVCGVRLHFEDSRYAPIDLDLGFTRKHTVSAGGYYVVYGDGYKSYSPAKAFEDGYTRINPNGCAAPTWHGAFDQVEEDLFCIVRALEDGAQAGAMMTGPQLDMIRLASRAVHRHLQNVCTNLRQYETAAEKLTMGQAADAGRAAGGGGVDGEVAAIRK